MFICFQPINDRGVHVVADVGQLSPIPSVQSAGHGADGRLIPRTWRSDGGGSLIPRTWRSGGGGSLVPPRNWTSGGGGRLVPGSWTSGGGGRLVPGTWTRRSICIPTKEDLEWEVDPRTALAYRRDRRTKLTPERNAPKLNPNSKRTQNRAEWDGETNKPRAILLVRRSDQHDWAIVNAHLRSQPAEERWPRAGASWPCWTNRAGLPELFLPAILPPPRLLEEDDDSTRRRRRSSPSVEVDRAARLLFFFLKQNAYTTGLKSKQVDSLDSFTRCCEFFFRYTFF
jgi:hypothetical protein